MLSVTCNVASQYIANFFVERVRTRSDTFERVRTRSNACERVRTLSNAFECARTRSNVFERIRTRSNAFERVRTRLNAFEPVANLKLAMFSVSDVLRDVANGFHCDGLAQALQFGFAANTSRWQRRVIKSELRYFVWKY